MDEKKLLQVLAEQREYVRSLDVSKWVNRREESLFELESDLAQVVVGVRRSGKSTLCHKALKGAGVDYAYVNMDDDRLFGAKTEDLNKLLSCVYQLYGTEVKWLFLDEIQNVDGWHLFLKRLLREGMHVFVTGSNAKLLSGELATHLTGRFNEIRLFPFSYAEYCAFHNVDLEGLTTKADAARKTALRGYLLDGGFPELQRLKNKRAYVQSLLESVVTKDIGRRYGVRNVDALRDIANHLVNNNCQEVNYTALADLFGLGSANTARKYVFYLKQAFLVSLLPKHSFKSSVRLRNEKSYVVDVGFLSNRENVLAGENLGWRLENAVGIELLRRESRNFGDVHYYKPTAQSKEVDFVVSESGRAIELLQVAYDVASPKTFAREASALMAASKALGCDNLTLVTLGESHDETVQGKNVRVRSAVDWLLGR